MSLVQVLGLLVALYLLPLVLGVIALRAARHKVPSLSAVDPTWLESSWVDRARGPIEQLVGLGFVLRTYVDGMAPRTAPAGIRCAAVLVNETTGDMAQVVVADRLAKPGVVEPATILVLSTSFGSMRVATTDSDMPSAFLRPREHVGYLFPMVHNVTTLLRVHRALCTRHAGSTKRGALPTEGTEVRRLAQDAANEFAYQAKRGMMVAVDANSYRPTWRGAIYGVWKLHPRFIGFHRGRMRTRARQVLADLGIPPESGEQSGTPPRTHGAADVSRASTAA